MSEPVADNLHRTLKLEIDEGRAETIGEAQALVGQYVLQVDVAARDGLGATREAILLTVVNAARRAFLGGVRVRIDDDPQLRSRWADGMRLREAIESYGGIVVGELESEHPTICLPSPAEAAARLKEQVALTAPRIYPTWEGWSGGVVEVAQDRLAEECEFPLAGVLAGALAVSESFRHVRGDPEAGWRSLGVSLWRPELDWTEPEATGPRLSYLPAGLWLLGLGHLGQSYAWSLGFLPYADTGDARIFLQDFDVVVEANESTGLLIDRSAIGQTKARALAGQLEGIGFETRITERPFDAHTQRTVDEPGLALAGFDDPTPRRQLEGANFDLIVDAGLGAGPEHYSELLIHSFPSGLSAAESFPVARADSRFPSQPAYRELVKRRVEAGESAGEAECGVLEIAGRTVGAAFVGAATGALVVSEALRMICRGPRYQVIDISLRSPQYREAVKNEAPGAFINPGFVPTI